MTAAEMQALEGDIIEESEAAEIIRETRRNFRQRRYDGTGPAFIKIGRKILYRRSAVLEWMLSHEKPAGTADSPAAAEASHS